MDNIKLLFEDSSVWYSQLLQDDNQLELLLNEPLSIVFINNEVSLLNERFGTPLDQYKFSEAIEEQEPNAPLCLEDRFTQLEKKFNQLQENYVNLLQYCGDLQIQVSFLNKYRNLAIGCKVEHVKKGHTVITHGLTSVTGLGSQPSSSFVDPQTSDTKVIKDNKIVTEKRSFFIMKWDQPVTFNRIRVATIAGGNTVFSMSNRYEFYISNDDENDHLELIAKVNTTDFDFHESVNLVTTRYLKVVLNGGKVLGINLFNIQEDQ